MTCLPAMVGYGGSLVLNFEEGLPEGVALHGSAEWAPRGGAQRSPFVSLTTPTGSQQGSMLLPELDPGEPVGSFSVSFQLRMGGGSVPPADGFSLNFASDLPDLFGEEGAGSGLTVSFDTFNNGCGEAPAIDIRYGGRVLASRRFAVGEINTGTNFVPVFVAVHAGGNLDLAYNGKVVFTNLLAYLPVHGRFGFGARTGALTDAHGIDDLKITTVPVGGPYTVDVQPWLESATSDSPIVVKVQDYVDKVVAKSIQLQLDGAAVIASASRADGVTTIAYQPPHALPAGTSHNVKLTYRDTGTPPATHTLVWDFSVETLTRGTFFVEAEDYNYLGGQYLPVPGFGPYAGGAYFGLVASDGIDLHVESGGTRNEYQRDSTAWSGTVAWGCDLSRGGFTLERDFKLESNDPGEWYNYTRLFPTGGVWNVYGRFTSVGQNAFATLDEVVSGSRTFEQSLGTLGFFLVPASDGVDDPVMVPLRDAQGALVRVRLSGERTFRFSIHDGHPDANYFAFVPAAPERLAKRLPRGFSLVSNPLSVGDNTLNEVIKGVPLGATVYLFNSTTGRFYSSVFLSEGSWVPNLPVPPGTGLFLDLPEAQEIIFEGQRLTGSVQIPLVSGFNLVASKWLQAGPVQSVLQFPALDDDIVFRYSALAYQASVFEFGEWPTGQPSINEGEGFWIRTSVGRIWEQNIPDGNNLLRSFAPAARSISSKATVPFATKPGLTTGFDAAAVNGTVQFCNVWPSHHHPVGTESFPGGVSDEYQAQLWAGPDARNLQGVEVFNQSPTRFSSRGEFNGGVVELPGVQPGGTAQVMVRAWHRDKATFEAASEDPNAIIFESTPFRIQTGGLGSPPSLAAYLEGLSGFRVRPVIEWSIPPSLVYGQKLADFSPPTAKIPDAGTAQAVPGSVVLEKDGGLPPQSLDDLPAAGPAQFTAVFTPTDSAAYLEARRTFNLTVTKAPLTVIAENANRTYGTPNPAPSVRFEGLVNGEMAEAVISGAANLTLSADTASAVGRYPIVPTLGTLSAANYSFVTPRAGTLEVTPAQLTVTVADAVKLFGEPNPALGGTITGLKNNDPVILNNTCAATAASPPGTYPIFAGLLDPNGKLGNYTVTGTANAGTLTVLPTDTRILTPAFVGGVFIVPVPTVAGVRYTLEYINALSGTQWQKGQTLSGTGGTIILSDPAANATTRYYRVKVEPETATPGLRPFKNGEQGQSSPPVDEQGASKEVRSADAAGPLAWFTDWANPDLEFPVAVARLTPADPTPVRRHSFGADRSNPFALILAPRAAP